MQWNNFWLWIVGVCRSCVCVCVLSVSLPSLWDFHASLIDYVKWADALIWCGSSSSISMPLSRFMSSTVGVGQMHKDDNTLHCMTTYFLNTHTCSPYKGSIWWGFKCKIKVKNVFFSQTIPRQEPSGPGPPSQPSSWRPSKVPTRTRQSQHATSGNSCPRRRDSTWGWCRWRLSTFFWEKSKNSQFLLTDNSYEKTFTTLLFLMLLQT